jgi:hypothetical protein
MNIDQKLDLLKKIQKVDAPPFMLTSIKERIHTFSSQSAPFAWKLAFVSISMLVITLNVSIFLNQTSQSNKQDIQEIVSVMGLSTQNELYHE